MRMLLTMATACLAIACAHQPSYSDQLAQRPFPSSDVAKEQECAWIRSEVARQRTLGAYAASTSPMYAVAFQGMAAQNVSALESRAASVGCYAPFRTDTPQKPAIASCIEACKANTQKTPERCFDACNK